MCQTLFYIQKWWITVDSPHFREMTGKRKKSQWNCWKFWNTDGSVWGVACSFGMTIKIYIKKVTSDERTNRGERISQADNLKSILTSRGNSECKDPGEEVCLYCVVVQSVNHVRLFVTPRTAARQPSLSFTVSGGLLKFMTVESVMLSNQLILCHPLLSCGQSFPASGSFPMSQLFTSDGQNIGVCKEQPMRIGWLAYGKEKQKVEDNIREWWHNEWREGTCSFKGYLKYLSFNKTIWESWK